jgi:hypothetical protein
MRGPEMYSTGHAQGGRILWRENYGTNGGIKYKHPDNQKLSSISALPFYSEIAGIKISKTHVTPVTSQSLPPPQR